MKMVTQNQNRRDATMKRLDIAQTSKEIREFLEHIKSEEETYLLEDQGKPILGIVPAWQVINAEERRAELLAMLCEVWARNRDIPVEDVEHDVEEAIQEVRSQPR
jgi:hypothetical protein